jgi:WD40 repeat protein
LNYNYTIEKRSPFKPNLIASTSVDKSIFIWDTEHLKPALVIPSISETNCLSWSKMKQDLFAVSSNNDIRLYDLRKTNSALKYIPNAHVKKIYSLDWCPIEDILLSCSRDRSIKLWKTNLDNNGFYMQLKKEKLPFDFSCWKAKFTPYGFYFAVIPAFYEKTTTTTTTTTETTSTETTTTLDQHSSSDFMLKNFKSKSNNENEIKIDNDDTTPQLVSSTTQKTLSNMKENSASLLICQITSIEVDVHKLISLNKNDDMIMDFDFNLQNGKFLFLNFDAFKHFNTFYFILFNFLLIFS